MLGIGRHLVFTPDLRAQPIFPHTLGYTIVTNATATLLQLFGNLRTAITMLVLFKDRLNLNIQGNYD